MFVDIRNFTPLADFLREYGGRNIEHLDINYPTIAELITQYCNDLSKDIYIFGRVNDFAGDGIMAVFGDMKKPEKDTSSKYEIRYSYNLVDQWAGALHASSYLAIYLRSLASKN